MYICKYVFSAPEFTWVIVVILSLIKNCRKALCNTYQKKHNSKSMLEKKLVEKNICKESSVLCKKKKKE